MKTLQNASDRFSMSRSQFLRTMGAASVAVASGLFGAGRVAVAQSTETVVDVYPTGMYPDDVYEVMAAVNGMSGPSGRTYPGGGIVRLKASNAAGAPMYFNFGGAYPSLTRGSVQITKDVTIVGEAMSPSDMTFPHDPAPHPDYRPDRTVVYGGKRAFACPSVAPTHPKVKVRNIFFAYPSLAAVQVAKSSGLEVTDCVVYDVRPDDTGANFSVANGIEATGLATGIAQLFGECRVMNNRIRRASPIEFPPTPPFVDSGIVLNLAGMDGQILANEVDRFPAAGVVIDRINGVVTLAANTCTNCGYGINPMSAGIVARGTTTPALIERNSVTGGYGGPSPSLPSKNGISVASSNVVVRSNTIKGAFASQGILLTPFVFAGNSWSATDDRIERNDLVRSTTMSSQVLLAPGCDRNRFANNDYGAVGSAASAGMVVHSAGNAFVEEHFWGTYSGAPGQPCILLASGSSGNTVSAFKYQFAPQGFDLCKQVLDQGNNSVQGAEKCR